MRPGRQCKLLASTINIYASTISRETPHKIIMQKDIDKTFTLVHVPG